MGVGFFRGNLRPKSTSTLLQIIRERRHNLFDILGCRILRMGHGMPVDVGRGARLRVPGPTLHRVDRCANVQKQVELTDVGWLDVLKPHFPHYGQNMLFSVTAVIARRVRPNGKVFAGEPALHVAFQGKLRRIEGHAALDLVRDLPDPVETLSLRLGILGDAPAAQADLGAPAAILALEDTAFVVASLFSHAHFSFL